MEVVQPRMVRILHSQQLLHTAEVLVVPEQTALLVGVVVVVVLGIHPFIMEVRELRAITGEMLFQQELHMLVEEVGVWEQ